MTKTIDEKVDDLAHSVTDLTHTVGDLTQTVGNLTHTVDDLTHTVDDLARMVADGFTEVRAEIGTIRKDMDAGFVDIRRDIATKSDLVDLEQRLLIHMDKGIGLVRTDYDALAGRVKDLESAR